MTEKEKLKRRIDVAAGRAKADLVIRDCRIVDVFSGEVLRAARTAMMGRMILTPRDVSRRPALLTRTFISNPHS